MIARGASRLGAVTVALGVATTLTCTGPDRAALPPQRIVGAEGLLGVEGAQLFYRTVGEGEPVIVVHGGPGMEHSYLLPELARALPGRRLVFYDQRGTGRSLGQVDSTTVTLDRFLDDIDSVRAALGVERVDLLAHSFGGFLALRYADRNPDRIRRLILLSTVEPGFRYAAESQERRNARRQLVDQRMLDSLTTSDAFRARDRETVNRVYELAFKPSFGNADVAERLKIEFTDRTARNSGRVAQFLVGPLGQYDDWGLLPGIEVPTLIVHGDADLLPLEAAAEMAAQMPAAHLASIEGVGHFPWLEDAERTREVVEGFLSGKLGGS